MRMERLYDIQNAYYGERYKNNGYIITGLPHGYIVWGKDKEVIKVLPTLEEAEEFTNNLPTA